MAIYHCSLRIFSRSDGHSAVAAAAYRAGAVLKDQRTGRIHRYGKRKGVIGAFILAPSSTPQRLLDRAVLWNAAEEAETRKNSRVAREVILALPHELSDADRQSLCRDMAGWLVERYRVAVDTAIHSPVQGDGHDGRNHHAHLLFTTRELGPEGLGKKTRILDDKEQGPKEVEIIREVWETLTNGALSRAGLEGVQIDRRTLEDQGIDRIPQTHVGPEAKASERAEKDDEEEGKGEDGKKGSGTGKGESSKSLSPTKITRKEPDTKKREIDYKTIDQGRRRSDFVEEIKRLNERRASFSSIPLKDQIANIERLIEKLDTRVHRLEAIKEKTGLGQRLLASFTKLAEFSKGLILGCEKYRGAVTLSETERATRAGRQREHYGREYRTGLHEQIKTMRSNLNRLEQLKSSYTAYKGFVEKIEKEIASTQPSITALQREQAKAVEMKTALKIITPAELSIKLSLKAEMVREIIPPQYKPKETASNKAESILSLKTELNKTTALPINLTNSFREQIIPAPREQSQNIASYKQPIKFEIKDLSKSIEERQKYPILKQDPKIGPTPDLADRKNWFIPASEKTKPLQETIDKTIAEQGRVIPTAPPERIDPNTAKGQFHTQAKTKLPPRQTTYEEIRERTSAEAQAKRKNIPPQYRAEPYEEPIQPETKETAETQQNNSIKDEWKTQAAPIISESESENFNRPKMLNKFNAASFDGTHPLKTKQPALNEDSNPNLKRD